MPTVELRRLGDFFSAQRKKEKQTKKLKSFCITIGFLENDDGNGGCCQNFSTTFINKQPIEVVCYIPNTTLFLIVAMSDVYSVWIYKHQRLLFTFLI
jgi:hypothetical protein